MCVNDCLLPLVTNVGLSSGQVEILKCSGALTYTMRSLNTRSARDRVGMESFWKKSYRKADNGTVEGWEPNTKPPY